MVKFVIKKDGTKSPLDIEKVKRSIMAAASEAGLASDKASSIASEVSNSALMSFGSQEEVATSDIKTKVLMQLDSSYPEVSAAWRKYDKDHGK